MLDIAQSREKVLEMRMKMRCNLSEGRTVFGCCKYSALVMCSLGLLLVKVGEGVISLWLAVEAFTPSKQISEFLDEPIIQCGWHLTFLYHQTDILDYRQLQLVPRAVIVQDELCGFCFPKEWHSASVIALEIFQLWSLCQLTLDIQAL